MPVYEYYCKKCDKVYEFIQRITDDPKTTCEVCNGPLKKQISLSSFHLKGSGWYVTDYGGKNNGNGSVSKAENDNQTTSDTKAEDKKKEKTSTPKAKESKSTSSSKAAK